MRRTAALSVAALLLVGVAPAAHAANTYSVEASTTPAREGSKRTPVPVGVDFAYRVGDTAGNRPSPVKRYSIRFAGLRVNGGAFPKCSVRRLERRGLRSCRKAVVGSGFIRNATGAANDPADRSIRCNAALTVVNARRNRAIIHVAGDPTQTDERRRCAIELAAPIKAKFRRRGRAVALEFRVPSSLLHPLPSLDNAVTEVTSTIDRRTRRVRGKRVGFFESVGGCRRGTRAVSVVFTPETGPPTTARTAARCR